MNVKQDIRLRVYITFTAICMLGAAIIIKAAMIQVQEGPKLRSLAKELHTRFDTLKAERGNIYTEDGMLLSSSTPEFDVHLDLSVIDTALFNKNIDTLCVCLSGLFQDKPAEAYKEELVRAYNEENTYYLIGKKLKYDQYEAMRSFPIFNKGKAIGGFIAESKEKRINPYQKLAYRTIGVYRDDSNLSGLEATYNRSLIGENGHRVVEKTMGNIWVPIEGSDVEPQNGKDIVTTLDIDIQGIAEVALQNVLEKNDCDHGTCVVMEVSTGKIRALANLGRQADGRYLEDFNYAMIATEPGSTFKLATLLSLLNDKYITVDDNVDAEGGTVYFAGRAMKDSHLGLHVLPIWKAFAESSNAAMAKLANTYYHDNPMKYVNHLYDLHLNKKTGIDLIGERAPVVRSPKDSSHSWSATSLPWMATGYGVQVTPLHTCMLYNSIANNGTMVKPYLISAIKEYGKTVQQFSPQVVVEHVCDANTLAQLRRCLRAVVTEGTAKGIESPFYTISGKTGTAQVADKGISYDDGVYQGSFVGFFPSEQPKYTICVVIRTRPHPKAYYGGLIAAPVFRMVADKIFTLQMGAWSAPLDSFAKNCDGSLLARWATAKNYRILLNALNKKAHLPSFQTNSLMELSTDSLKQMTVQPAKIFKNVMPDVKGMGLKDAVFVLESCGLQVQVFGKGKVQSQSILAGERVNKGQNIVIQLG